VGLERRLSVFAIVSALIVLLLALFLRRGDDPRSVTTQTPKLEGQPRETTASPEPAKPAQAQGKGTLEVQFELAFNASFWIVVMRESMVETRKWARIAADPRTDPKNYTPKNVKIDGLSPGSKRILIVANKFVERKVDVTIREEETTAITIQFENDPYQQTTMLEGNVFDSRGKPIQGAQVTVETDDPECIISANGPRLEIWNEKGGVSSSLHLHGPGNDVDPYSQEYLEDILKPNTRHFSEDSWGAQAFSDGTLRMYWVTSDSGWFRFSVKVKKPYVVTAEYQGVEKKAVAKPGERSTIVLPVEAGESPSFQDQYGRAMNAMILKDLKASEEIHRILELRARDPKREAGTKTLMAAFEQAAGSPVDFNSRDVKQRDAFISTAKKIAHQIAFALTVQEK